MFNGRPHDGGIGYGVMLWKLTLKETEHQDLLRMKQVMKDNNLETQITT